MANADKQRDHLNEDEAELLRQLREVRREQRLRGSPDRSGKLSNGQRVADMRDEEDDQSECSRPRAWF